MAYQKTVAIRSFPVDSAPTTPRAKGIVVAWSATNNGAVRLCTASLLPCGVLTGPTDSEGFAPIETGVGAIVQVIAGGSITKGNTLGVDANGNAVAITPSGSGTTLRYLLGVAVTDAGSGELVDVQLLPGYCQT